MQSSRHRAGPVSQVFAAELGDFREISYSTEVSQRRQSVHPSESSSHSPSGLRFRWSLAGMLLAMADDVGAIRQLLERHGTHPEDVSGSGLRG